MLPLGFPHQLTGDQFFNEAQFESCRLGLLTFETLASGCPAITRLAANPAADLKPLQQLLASCPSTSSSDAKPPLPPTQLAARQWRPGRRPVLRSHRRS